MANSLITWYNRFFRESGLGNGSPEGSRKILFKKEMMAYSYKVKGKFFEESSTKIWRTRDGIDRNLYTAYKAIRNSYSIFWKFDWDVDRINWLELELIDGRSLLITIDTDISQLKAEIYLDKLGHEKCRIPTDES